MGLIKLENSFLMRHASRYEFHFRLGTVCVRVLYLKEKKNISNIYFHSIGYSIIRGGRELVSARTQRFLFAFPVRQYYA